MPPERVVVHVDGGARGNPGPAGVGVVVTDDGGASLPARTTSSESRPTTPPSTGQCCSGSTLAHALGAREVEIVNDSELVARQLAGDYRVKSADLKPLYAQALQALQRFGRWSIRSVPREQNETPIRS